MSHKDALANNIRSSGTRDETEGFVDQAAYEKYKSTYNGLSSRPDWDGVVNTIEAIKWYNSGNGDPLYVDISKMDFRGSSLTTSDFSNTPQDAFLQVNFFFFDTHISDKTIIWRPGGFTLATVYGTLRMVLDNAKTGQVHLQSSEEYSGGFDAFDFDKQTKTGKVDHFLGDYLYPGEPKSFNFFGYGKGFINTELPPKFVDPYNNDQFPSLER